MTGVKFYGTFNPAWLPAAAAEAHRLGLHVSGHVPAGMRTLDAIEAGYDEVTHIYFMMMQAMPDEVVAVSNGIQRFQGPGRYAKDVDLDGEAIRKLIADDGAQEDRRRPDPGRRREPVRAREWRSFAGLCAVRRHPAAGDGARLPPGRLRGSGGPDPGRLAGELPQARRTGRSDAQGGRAGRRRDRRQRPGAGPRARALRRATPASPPPRRWRRRRSSRRGWSAPTRRPARSRSARRRTWCWSTATRRSGSATSGTPGW